jgi:cytoskeletal protein RodZ
MSVWKVLLIWLTAFAGTGCLGLLLVVFLTTIREADEKEAQKSPPRPASPIRWWYFLIYAAVLLSADYVPQKLLWFFLTAAFLFIAGILLRCVIIGWRTQQDAHFFAKAAGMCAVITAISGYALWRSH